MTATRIIAPLITTLLLIGTSGASVAQEELMEARKCWNLLPEHIDIGASVDLALELEEGVVKSVAVVGFKPETQLGYDVAQSALRAVEECGPYDDYTDQVILTFNVDAKLPASDILNPAKQ